MKVETSNVGVELNPFLAPTGTPKKKVVLQPRQLWEKPRNVAAVAPPFFDPGTGVVSPGVLPSVNIVPAVYNVGGECGPVVPQPGHGVNLNPVSEEKTCLEPQSNDELTFSPSTEQPSHNPPMSNHFVDDGAGRRESAHDAFIKSLSPRRDGCDRETAGCEKGVERGAGDEVLPGVFQFGGLQRTPVQRKSTRDRKQPDRYSEGCVEIFIELMVYYNFIVYCMSYSC